MKKKSSRKLGASHRSCAGPTCSASVISALRADADSWEECAKALGYINDEGERRGKERVAMLRAAADRIEQMLDTLHLAYQHALDASAPINEGRLSRAQQKNLGRRLANYWCDRRPNADMSNAPRS